MNCANCGAPLRSEPGRDYLVCDHCTSFYFPEPTADGVQRLGEDSTLCCPRCRRSLVSATVAASQVLYCDHCRGILVDQWAFATVVQLLRARAAAPPTAPEPIDPAELAVTLHCPRCSARMEVHPYYGPGNIVVDSCGACHLLYLDHGELRQVVDAPGRDRARPW